MSFATVHLAHTPAHSPLPPLPDDVEDLEAVLLEARVDGTEEPAEGDVGTREVTIKQDVELPSGSLQVGKTYNFRCLFILKVTNDEKSVVQDDLHMRIEWPGVLSRPFSARRNFYVKRRQTKVFEVPFEIRGVRPEKAGKFTLRARSRFFGESHSESQEYEVRD